MQPLPNSLQMQERVVNLAQSSTYIRVTLLTSSTRTLSAIRTRREVIRPALLDLYIVTDLFTLRTARR